MAKYSPDKECVVMTRDQVRAFDNWAISEIGIPGIVLMENAGRSCTELILERLDTEKNPTVCIFCGTGNNGGDGYVIARHLINHGINVRVAVTGPADKIKGDAKINLNILKSMHQPVEELQLKQENWELAVSRL